MRSYWKLFLGLLLIFAAVLVCTCGYMPAREEYLRERALLEESLSMLQHESIQNSSYLDVMEQIPAARKAVADIRSELFELLPSEMKEEDQLLYVADMEAVFDKEISFDFGETEELAVLDSGAVLAGLKLTLNFPANFDEFRSIVKFLEQQYLVYVSSAALEYDPITDESRGSVTITHYLIDDISEEE